MLEDLTQEEWCGWLTAFYQSPWDQQRLDDRNAVACLWSVSPYIEDEAFKAPGFIGPEYKSDKEENTGESWERLQKLKQRVLNGEFNRKISDPTNG